MLPPTLAHQWEAGAKTEFFDGRLSASFAYFDLTKTNVAVTDPSNPNQQITRGEQESRGYEFETAGEILPGWRAVAAYTHLAYAAINKETVATDFDEDGNTGNRLYNAPRNYGSFGIPMSFKTPPCVA